MRPSMRTERTGTRLNKICLSAPLTWFWVRYPYLSPNLEDVVVIAIDSTMSPDEIKKRVADCLHDKARYIKVLKRKGYPESQARKLLTLMISFFSN